MSILGFLAFVCLLGLFAVWGFYPAVIGILARLRRGSAAPCDGSDPFVSIVVATRDAPMAVVERVRDLLRTTFSRDHFEIVIACDRSLPLPQLTDSLRNLSGNVRLVLADEPGGKAAGLNAALRVAEGEIVVFADTHQRFDPGTIAALVRPFSRSEVGAVTGNYRLAPGAGRVVSLYWTFEQWLRRCEAKVHSSVGATGAVWALRRALWAPLRSGLILDDVYTPMRVVLSGYRVAVAPDATALETRKPTPSQEYGRKVRTLTGVLQLCAWLPAVLVPLRNPVWPQFVFHKLLRLLTPYFVLVPLAWALVLLLHAWEAPALIAGLLVAAIVGIWIARARGRLGTRVRRVLIEGMLLQIAAVVAGFNGIRGHWRVWDA